jgi:hypothetical protein
MEPYGFVSLPVAVALAFVAFAIGGFFGIQLERRLGARSPDLSAIRNNVQVEIQNAKALAQNAGKGNTVMALQFLEPAVLQHIQQKRRVRLASAPRLF